MSGGEYTYIYNRIESGLNIGTGGGYNMGYVGVRKELTLSYDNFNCLAFFQPTKII